MNELAIADQKFTIRETGIEFHQELDFEEWESLGYKLARVGKSIGFIIGDWINYGEKLWGEKYQDAINRSGLDYQTLRDFAYVAGRIELSLRNDNLDFNHHRVVAKLPSGDQKEWLKAAEKHGLSVRRLRKSINVGRVVSQDEMQEDPSDKGHVTYMVFINRLCQWWRKVVDREPIEQWDEYRRETLKRDLKPLVEIYEKL